jgi:putative peptidoglycan lipid II flippase
MNVSKLTRSSVLLGVAACAVSAVAFLKTVLAARYFGVSGSMDALNLVIALPNLAGGILLGALQASMVPVLVGYYEEGRASDARRLVVRAAWKLSISSLLLGAAYWIFSNQFLSVIGSGLDEGNRAMAAHMLPWAAAVIPISACIAVMSCILMARERLVVLAYLPGISSALSIVFLLAVNHAGPSVLVYSLALGCLLQLLIILAIAMRLWKLRPNARISFPPESRHDLPATFYPLLLAASFGLTNTIVDQAFASPLGAGSVTALTYAISLNGLLSQMTIFASATVLLPVFSRITASQKPKDLTNLLRRVFQVGAMIFFPLTVIVLVLGRPLVWLLLGRGEFGIAAAGLTGHAWAGYAVSLAPFFWGIVLTRVYHALRRPMILLWTGAIAVVLNGGLDYAFGKIWGVTGIALSTSAVYLTVTALLVWQTQKEFGVIFSPAVVSTTAKAIFASGILLIELKVLTMSLDLTALSKPELALRLGITCLVGVASYAGVGAILKLPLQMLVRGESSGAVVAPTVHLRVQTIETSDLSLK